MESTDRDKELVPNLSFLKLGIFTDFTIETADTTFKVHSYVLYGRSGYFRRLLSGQNLEVSQAKVKLDGIPSCLVARFIRHCYSVKASISTEVVPSDFPQHEGKGTWSDEYRDATENNIVAAELCIKMYQIADRLGFEHLRRRARRYFLHEWCNADSKRIADHPANWSNFSYDKLEAPEQFVHLVKLVYDSTSPYDREMRNIVFERFCHHVDDGYVHRPRGAAFKSLLESTPDLAVDICCYGWDDGYPCDECNDITQAHIIRPCSCTKTDDGDVYWCKRRRCLQALKDQSFCRNCCAFGTIATEKVTEEDSGTSVSESEDNSDSD